ncbi:unnamed protein product [Linum trigynum]|uniref:Gnk2-homologous domain-containing protein n=1 Tax=Linum trigynum TaxID=586398 RepID=A0AAV2G3Z7_9ROSI
MAVIRIITLILLSHFLAGSGASPSFCGTDRPWFHAAEFPSYVENALNYVVQNAASGYQNPGLAQSNDVECSNFSPAQAHGAAWAVATCYAGVTPGDCTACLSDALPYVRGCKKNTLGGARYEGRCWLRFGQYMP